MYDILKNLALPPANLVLLLAIAVLLLATGWRRLGFCLTVLSLVALYLLSTPYIAGQLGKAVQSAQPLPPGPPETPPAEAIVVLSAGLLPNAPEYASGAVDEITLQRLAYAAYLWRQYKVPILVSGGEMPGSAASLARVMKDSLEQVFGVPVQWMEDKSTNTYENARFSAAILRGEGIARVLLVTHAAHMPRAVRLFDMTGLVVIPAPTAFIAPAHTFPESFLPRQSALQYSYYAIYELFGGVWYALQGKTMPASDLGPAAR